MRVIEDLKGRSSTPCVCVHIFCYWWLFGYPSQNSHCSRLSPGFKHEHHDTYNASVRILPLVSEREKNKLMWGENRLFYHLFVVCLRLKVSGFVQLPVCSKGQL